MSDVASFEDISISNLKIRDSMLYHLGPNDSIQQNDITDDDVAIVNAIQ